LSSKENPVPRLIFRTEGGHRTGMGHLKRCLRLAGYLRERLSPEITFILSPSDILLADFFLKTPYKTLYLEEGREKQEVDELCLHHPPQAWITDLRHTEDKVLFQGLADRHRFLHIAIDDMHLSGVEAEITFNPSVLPCDPSRHSFPPREYYCGPEYFFSFPDKTPPLFPKKNGKRILIAMGGADIHGVTPRLLRSFLKTEGEAQVHVVQGPAFRDDAQMDFAAGHENVFFHPAPASLDPLISSVDLVITTGGLTLYETARLGVASLAVTQNPFESRTARAFEEKDACLFQGEGDRVETDRVAATALALLQDRQRLGPMGLAGQELIKGGGGEMVEKILKKHFFV